MLIQELLIQITGLLENINANMESIGEVIKELNPSDPDLMPTEADDWDGPTSWSVKKGGWRGGQGWDGPGDADW